MGAVTQRVSLHVWQDNETDVDFLGFRVHSDLIRSVVTDPAILPVTVGVFGDWGGGKSSIMKMLQKDLSDEATYPKIVCLYFNGWTFEGYEDAKSALLTSILIQLGEHKRFGPKVKGKVVKLLKRVKWMEVGKFAVKSIGVPLAAALLTGGVSAIPAAATAAAGVLSGKGKDDEDSEDAESPDWSGLIDKDPGKADLLGVRKFRDEFSKLLGETNIDSLVVLIDDLDRCLPERLIETLEAIKLFVAVPRTAFVIGADPRIVRHAISDRYVKRQLHHTAAEERVGIRDEEEKLIKDYLEKLIQVPYHLPRLSPSEIETYLNLLACQKVLPTEDLTTVLRHWEAVRESNVFEPCTEKVIQTALGHSSNVPDKLAEQLSWSAAIAPVITDGLKGNPRQVKRMLNAMSLRKQLASTAKIIVKDDALAKLMVLEYSNLPLFQQLNEWQSVEGGIPNSLALLEEHARADEDDKKAELVQNYPSWQTSSAQMWLRMSPRLHGLDLREYFWLARDRTESTLSGVVMLPPAVQVVYRNILSSNQGERSQAVKSAVALPEPHRILLLDSLKRDAERLPGKKEPFAALHTLAVNKLPGAAERFIEAAGNSSPSKLHTSVPQNIAELAKLETGLRQRAISILTELSSHNSPAGKAAKSALTTLQKGS